MGSDQLLAIVSRQLDVALVDSDESTIEIERVDGVTGRLEDIFILL